MGVADAPFQRFELEFYRQGATAAYFKMTHIDGHPACTTIFVRLENCELSVKYLPFGRGDCVVEYCAALQLAVERHMKHKLEQIGDIGDLDINVDKVYKFLLERASLA